MIPVALGDLLEDPRKLRGQTEMALSSGVGYVYLDQIRNVGRPDAAFRSRACWLTRRVFPTRWPPN